ncbi:MAG: MFS transporter [Muribaculaceae bacterium]|jgi:fucose permease|nr:MFS transporter [Muribaculaceae bacterium]MEE1298219.1 MFS transporter [Muribaculaceae bacterium]
MNQTTGYRKNLIFVIACIGMCFFGIATITLGSILPQLTEKLGFDNLQAASLVAFMPVGSLVGSIFFGPVVDRYGHKSMLILCSLILLLGLQGVAFFKEVYLLQMSIFLIGLGGGVLNGETNALASDISEPHEKGTRLSILGVFYGVGAISIPMLLRFLSAYYSYNQILNGLGAIMLIAIFFFMAVSFPAPKQAKGFPIKKGIGLLKEKGLLLLSFMLFFQSGIEVCCSTWTTSYFKQVTEITPAQGLTALTLMIIGLSLSRIVLAVVYRTVKQEKVLPYSLIIGIVGFGLLTNSPDYLRAYAGMFLIGAGLAATFPTILSLIGGMFAELSGTAFSIALAVGLCGQIVFNYSTGALSQVFGIQLFPYLMISGIVLMLILFKIKTSLK